MHRDAAVDALNDFRQHRRDSQDAQAGEVCRLFKQLKRTDSRISSKVGNCHMSVSQRPFDITSRAITQAQPENLGRKAEHHTYITEIRVFGNDDVVVRPSILPDSSIVGCSETN